MNDTLIYIVVRVVLGIVLGVICTVFLLIFNTFTRSKSAADMKIKNRLL